MGTSKIVCVHITQESIRLLEGKVQGREIQILQAATLSGAEMFFDNGRLSALAEMVDAVVHTMTLHSFSSKELHIVYDNNLEVDFFLNEKPKQKKTSKYNITFGKKNDKDKDTSEKSLDGQKNRSAVIQHKKQWGQFVTEFEHGEMNTTTIMERDLVKFMVSAFGEYGYKVVSIEPPETALMYLRNMVPFTYDSLHKLVIYANDAASGTMYQFTKDMPAGTKKFHFDDIPAPRLADKTIGVIKEEIRKSSLHGPSVFLVGDAFNNIDTYVDICEGLKKEGITPIDMYGAWNDNALPFDTVEVSVPEDVDFNVCGQYGLCVCMLARTMEKKPENMIEGLQMPTVGWKTKHMAVDVSAIIAALFMLCNVTLTGVGVAKDLMVRNEIKHSTNATEVQLTQAQNERDLSKAEAAILQTLDERYKDIFSFAYQHVSNDLNIASIDTIDMIPVSNSSGSNYSGTADDDSTDGTTDGTTDTTAKTDGGATDATADNSTTTDGSVDATDTSSTAFESKTLVIRGYARNSYAPVKLYNELSKVGMGEVKISGVQQVKIPSNETLFAFELTVAPEGE